MFSVYENIENVFITRKVNYGRNGNKGRLQSTIIMQQND